MKIKKVVVGAKAKKGNREYSVNFEAEIEDEESISQVVNKLKERCNFYLEKWLEEIKEELEKEEKEKQKENPFRVLPQKPYVPSSPWQTQPAPSKGIWYGTQPQTSVTTTNTKTATTWTPLSKSDTVTVSLQPLQTEGTYTVKTSKKKK